jgi:hypothetical protein
MRLTEQQIEAGRSPNGGWTRQQLAKWGIAWPPPKGWRKALTSGHSTASHRTIEQIINRLKSKQSAADWPNIPFARFYSRKPFTKW